MESTTIYKHESGDWVTDWYGHKHHITFNPVDEDYFISLGLLEQAAVKFEVNQRGVILGVYNNRTGEALDNVTIPTRHALQRELNIGRPV